MERIKLFHVITGLNTGGAETMLYKLLSGMDADIFSNRVISLMDIGPVGKKIHDLGVTVQALYMRRGVPDPRGIVRLTGLLRKERPRLVQTWMYHSDLIGGCATKIAGNIPVIWNIRHSNLDPRGNKRTTIWAARACARLSRRLPSTIICCSEAAARIHAELGYAKEKIVVIPNGFALSTFKPDPEAKLSVRRELNIPDTTLLIGLVARFNPQKDHQNFIQAASLLYSTLHEKQLKVHFVLCGDGVTWENRYLADLIEQAGMRHFFHLLGRREDMPRLTAAFDIATSSSSYGEGFPNVVGEAMAAGVPCVVTDVGDAAYIVGDTGKVVPPKNPKALAEAWQELIAVGPDGRAALGAAARKRVGDHFDLAAIVKRYESLYMTVLNDHA